VRSVGECSERRLDVVPSLLVLQAAFDELGDEGASAAGTDPAIQLSD
jgi:hypothetical protein